MIQQSKIANGSRSKSNSESKTKMGLDPNPFYAKSLVEWDMTAPLEVIYEGEEDEQNNVVLEDKEERYPSLSLYYPESDLDSLSDCDFPVIREIPINSFFCLYSLLCEVSKPSLSPSIHIRDNT
ncbi:hypothetical protein ACSBR1_000853 [Camellia fascicularis]